MGELEAELRRLAERAFEAAMQLVDRDTSSFAGERAYIHAADLARDHEAAKREGGWMPIESAPRDGSVIWCGEPFSIAPAAWIGDRWVNWYHGGRYTDSGFYAETLWFEPTHWRLLPDSPVAEGEG